MTNIAAHTAAGHFYPPYVSVNECDGHIEITVRNHPRNGMSGDTATICISKESWIDLVQQINKE